MVSTYDNDPRAMSWTDGAPTASSNKNLNGIYMSGVGNGFKVTAPADSTRRTLVVHVGGWKSGGKLLARLSDESAADYTDTVSSVAGQYNRNYTLTYQAGRANQTLEVTWTMASGEGNVTLNAAALTGGTPNNSAAAGTVVKLEWDPPARTGGASDVASYRIFRSTDPNSFPGPPIAEIPAGSPLTYTDTDARRGQTYYYQVRTVSSRGIESPPTNVVQSGNPDPCATAPLMVTGIKWPAARSEARSLSWDSATRNIVSVTYTWPSGLGQSAMFTDDRGCTFLAKN
jgi:hypothetical protein